MLLAVLATPLALQLALADGVPTWDVRPSCRGAAAAGYMKPTEDRLKVCLDSEERARDELQRNWGNFIAADRNKCVESIQWFEPTYTELAACLEMSRDVRTDGVEKPTTTGQGSKAK
jgi:hypothetical protein